MAITLTNLGNAYGALGDAAKKKELLERALAIEEAAYGPDHPEVAITLTNLGNAYGDLGDAAKQKELLERALAIKEAAYGPDHTAVAITLTNLGNAYGELGDPAKQKELLERALAIEEAAYGPDHRGGQHAQRTSATRTAPWATRRSRRSCWSARWRSTRRRTDAEHPKVAITLANLGNAYGDLGTRRRRRSCSSARWRSTLVHGERDGGDAAVPVAQHVGLALGGGSRRPG